MKQNESNHRQESSWGGFQYRWNYDEYQKTLQRRRKKNASRGMRTFCLTTVFVFVLCFASLVIVMTAAFLRGTLSSIQKNEDRGMNLSKDNLALPQNAAHDPETEAGTQPVSDHAQQNGNGAEAQPDPETLMIPAETNASQDEKTAFFVSPEALTGMLAETAAVDRFAGKTVLPGTVSASAVNEIAAKCTDSTVTVLCKNSTLEAIGSGFFLSSDGYFVTNYHVIRKFDAWSVMLHDGIAYDAMLIASSPENDLALLKIDAEQTPAVIIGDSDSLVIGDAVVAIGTPGSLEFAGTVTYGNISGLNREVPITDERENVLSYCKMLQISAAINPGNSGGPLFNIRGEVVGINTMKLIGDGYEGMGFSIPIDSVIGMLGEWISDDRAQKAADTAQPDASEPEDAQDLNLTESAETEACEPVLPVSLGIRCEGVTEEESVLYRVPRGFLIRFVEPDSIAEQNGIKSGDILLSADGNPILTKEDFDTWEGALYAGDTTVIRVFRGGEERDITVQINAPDLTPNTKQRNAEEPDAREEAEAQMPNQEILIQPTA